MNWENYCVVPIGAFLDPLLLVYRKFVFEPAIVHNY